MNRIFPVFLAFFLLLNFPVHAQSLTVDKKDLKKLFQTMAGEYNSEAQSIADTSFFNISLRMKPFWKESTDGYWLYVEQAIAANQEKPYRQRAYHLYIGDDTTIISKVFELKNPSQYIGAWKDANKLKNITVDSLIDRQGCGILLHKQKNNVYTGATPGKQCLSSLRGATYATSEVSIYSDRLLSWDRGWDANDKQVWGAVKSGYIFIKSGRLKY